MAYELREGSGNAFKNKNKTEDRHPDYKTTVLVGGKPTDVALWERLDKNGNLYFGVKVSPGREQQPKGPQTDPFA